MRRWIPVVGLAFTLWLGKLIVTSFGGPQLAPALKNYRLILENEKVRVGKVVVQAGESEGVHVHPYPRVLICLEGATIEVRRKDGSVERTTYRRGEARYQSNTDPHVPANIGETRFTGIIVELKQ